ncbi:MAG TPA: trehalose-6-phosphate synthase [Candidatus Eisenbacteria bacterium]|nr:trehalose-6-phosphate synthase [Candidatus Eisenbacteria bacterium]
MTPDTERRGRRILHALTRAATREKHRRDVEHQTRPEQLERSVREYLGGTRIVIASNREPYQHFHRNGTIEAIRSAGGLASALDSVARATGGVWVAQASGDADRETVDERGRVAMPPGRELYTLQRVWIDDQERAQGFNRFVNGCLWPLCHVVYVRPHFVGSEWRAYQEVNRQFADAILEATGDEPAIVLLQDYHLALCAAELRKRRRDLTIVLFWHIPWPNPEVYRIVPWKREILEGLLSCDLLGFHIRYHGMNFLDTVSQELESLIDRERGSIRRRGGVTFVRDYPISPDVAEISLAAASSSTNGAVQRIRQRLGIEGCQVILGVDRLDYTKGIPERLDAYGRLLERHPHLQGRVTMIQIAVPSRVDLPEYQALGRAVSGQVDALNERFGTRGAKPVHLIFENLDFRELIPYYAMADVMAVTSLHDGMNLVSKEYVAAKVDGNGVLVLSPFTGASRELEHAIQVSPYDTERLAGALHQALTLPEEERSRRMRALREVVAAQNIYDWARKLLRDVRRLHLLPGVPRPAARR